MNSRFDFQVRLEQRGATLLLVFLLALFCCSSAQADESRRLALLVAAPLTDEDKQAMPQDIREMKKVLQTRGFSKDTIRELNFEPGQRRQQLMSFLSEAQKQFATWSKGQVFLYYSGHGDSTLCGECSALRPGLQLSEQELVYWDEVFRTLNVPKRIDLILLPDC